MLHSSSRRPLLPLLLVLLLAQLPALAQQKRLTMEDAFLNRSLQPENVRQLSWIPASQNEYSYLRTSGGQDELMQSNIAGNLRVVITLAELGQALQAAGAPAVKAAAFPVVTWANPQSLLVTRANKVYRIDAATKQASAVFGYDAAAENVEMDPTKTRVAYTKAQNLYLSAAGRENEAVTTETNPGIVNGQAAHRSEFGITKGTFWSPSGGKLAYYRMDQTMVTDYPLVDVSTTPAQAKPFKYPMAGDKSHEVTVGVYDLASRKTVFLQTGEPKEQYLTNISWSPDEKSIYIAVLNRGQSHLKLNQYDAGSGAFVKTLFEEKSDKDFVEPLHELKFVPGHPDQFLWRSQRDGYEHIYLYSTSGKLLRQLTKGPWQVTDVLGFADNNREVVFQSTEASPLERQVYAMKLSGGKLRRLSQEKGTHTATLSPGGTLLFDVFSNITTPRMAGIIGLDGKLKQQLLNAENPLTGYALGETKLVTIKAADGTTDLYGRLTTPPNFDPAKKYPTVVYLYGGPHVQLVTDSWLGGGNLWMQLMAQKGYVVFTVDSRGSGNRGSAFERATFRQLGTVEMADQLKGVDYLKSLPYVDQARMGIHGWSFGGFMTTTMMTRSPGTFKVGVGGGPVIDWRMYEIMYTERYMDTPQENPEGYQKANLLNYVDKLQGKLLLIHGTVDDVVVWQHSLDYLKTAVDKGVQLDYFVYPGHPHNVSGKDRVHLYNKITQYFDDKL
ncbi:DPP IV N-terminal domain-containing protein [Microvirga sp. STR05]|uniref:DPP IV N-terminal domain-containing protein n=1 Tax=Hymenobacter duratus TaxID=2771356 RepID=A0ABR8JIU2_9BACT|nr:DPP IV N-terminal domain-containing protein [Hymenobacter duratus]MBD2715533.1 DPP IV N-terminal domain-containing protein [Hymenobacter duratus]MBR7950441.1 DPP IV N-terminal domain-containing protein [Microvirga sp. STR05]